MVASLVLYFDVQLYSYESYVLHPLNISRGNTADSLEIFSSSGTHVLQEKAAKRAYHTALTKIRRYILSADVEI